MMQIFKAREYREFPFHLTIIFWAATLSIYSGFINIYLTELGYSNMTIGLLSAVAPAAAMLIQPFLGMWADRARSKNLLLVCLFVAQTVIMLLFKLVSKPAVMGVVMAVWTAVQSGALALFYDILMNNLSRIGRTERYGKVRLSHSAAYGIFGALIGLVISGDTSIMFLIGAGMVFLSILPAMFMVNTPGGQSEKGKQAKVSQLFTYRRLWAVLIAALILCISNSFTYTYVPVRFTELGIGTNIYGWSILLMTMSEWPFLIFSGKLIDKVGAERLLIIPGIALTARWLIVGLSQSPVLLFLSQGLHGMCFVIIQVCVVRFVSDTVDLKLSATAQAIANILLMNLSRVLGGLLGGPLVTGLGTNNAFLCMAGLAAVMAVTVTAMCAAWKKNKK